MSLIERAVVTSSGQPVRVLRRRSLVHDEQIMRALELAGHFVIGTPSGFRYRREGKRGYTRPEPRAVYVLDDEGAVIEALPPAYFAEHYTIVVEDDL